MIKTLALFGLTAVSEILGCYLPLLVMRKDKSSLWLIPAAGFLFLFVWLLSLHPQASGRVYAAYGGVYVSVALLWLWLVDSIKPTLIDGVGVTLCLLGMLVIMFGQKLN